MNSELYFSATNNFGSELFKYTPCIDADNAIAVNGRIACANTNSQVTIPASQVGASYQLYAGNTPVGTAVNGGGSINLLVPGAYLTQPSNVFKVAAITKCDTTWLTDTALITTMAKPTTTNLIGATTVNPLETTAYSVKFNTGSVYYWIITGGNQTSGGNTSAIQVTWGNGPSGKIQVYEQNTSGCNSDTLTLLVNVGANDIKRITTETLNITPNPGNGLFSISFINNSALPATIVVTDINGRNVYNDSYNVNGQVKHSLNLQHLPAGIYTITIQMGDKLLTDKLVIQH